jgi:putative colanic acid biosynthesis UDP-glucose lipid carrier transferase
MQANSMSIENGKDILNWGYLFMLIDALIILGMTHLWFFSIYDDRFITIPYQLSILTLIFTAVASSYKLGVYKYWRHPSAGRETRAVLTAWLVTFSLLAILAFLLKIGANFSRTWIISSSISSILLILLSRSIFRSLMSYFNGKNWNRRNIVIIGEETHIRTLSELISNQWWTGINVVSTYGYSSSSSTGASSNSPGKESMQSGLNQFLDKCSETSSSKIDRVCQAWIILEDLDSEKIEQLNATLETHPLDIVYVPNLSLITDKNNLLFIAGIPVIIPETSSLSANQQFLKYLFDYTVALLILVLIAPLMLIIALGVKLSSPGPVFYRQQRVSLHGAKFDMLKFRSMPVNTESQSGPVWARPGENRATKFGAFLRKSSLDELPQFFNVLRGEMSIVGPRPERPEFVDAFKLEVPKYMHKHLLKAGITGWAQVNGFRGDTSLSRRIEHDLYYIKHWSIIFDLRIIFMTLYKGFVHRSAY